MQMNYSEIARQRLQNQHLISPKLVRPEDVVARLGAVQAQDFAGANWALSMRMKGAPMAESVEEAFTTGKILRTHMLRPTWHYVSAADIRWMLELTAPRVHAASSFMYRQLELNRAIIKKSYAVLEKTLRGGKHLTRTELGSALEMAGIPASGVRLGYFMMSAELDGIICSGGRRGKQFTYALLEERVPAAKPLERDQALAELSKRYFKTRGPATLHDFTWWSGLTMADARQGVEMIRSDLSQELLGGQPYWFPRSMAPAKFASPTARLLPNYDEYFIGFKDRSAIGDAITRAQVSINNSALIANIVTIDGQVVGGWRRTLKKDTVSVELSLLTPLTKIERRAVESAAGQFGKFLGLSVQLTQQAGRRPA